MQPAPDAPNQQARLEWDEQGQPLSSQFADVYFSNENALAETRYVFLANNQLPERFAALTADQQLVIGETGFGTGLNFLCAWQLFEQHAVASARLHFVSVEKFPLNKADLQRALALWPELEAYAEQLLAQYVALHPGFQRLVFANGRIILTLLIGDALLVVFTLGLGFVFLSYRHWKFFMTHLEARGEILLDDLTQSTTATARHGEGLLDAFDMGAI